MDIEHEMSYRGVGSDNDQATDTSDADIFSIGAMTSATSVFCGPWHELDTLLHEKEIKIYVCIVNTCEDQDSCSSAGCL